MNIQEAKKIRLVDFLGGLGHHPVIQRGNSVWYKSPFRMEKEASFKIDLRKELWYDFGLGEGGSIIDLVMRMERCEAGKAIRLMEQRISGMSSFSFHLFHPFVNCYFPVSYG